MVEIKLPTGVFKYDPSMPLGKPGGFGQVFLGQTANGDEVAIKRLHVSAADTAHRELQIAEELKGKSHEHVIGFIDAGEDADSGNYFVVMTKAERSLREALEKSGPLTAGETISVLLQIVQGLLEVGELVHRDLKPDNILLHEKKWKIADFGIARFVEEATASNSVKECLSAYFAAPEQWRLERATHATDIYALGCIAFFVITGTPPFTSDPAEEHQKAPVPPFQCTDSRLSTLTSMMLRKIPATRPTLSRVRTLLEEFASKSPPNNQSSLTDLAQSAAKIADDEQKYQAKVQAERTEASARMRLAEIGFEILKDNLERLAGKINNQAPNASRRSTENAFQYNLGQSHIYVDFWRQMQFGGSLFRQSRWDVVALSLIKVTQDGPTPYTWSASLWYMKLPDKGEFRWYEISYWSPHGTDPQPFAVSDPNTADRAASEIGGRINLAFGPQPVDDEAEDDFHSRWIWLLAKAAAGGLRHPKLMPITQWPPSF
jgi:serine/threonine-protein kinase